MWNPLKLVPNREIDEFSRSLARELAERYPATLAPEPTDKKGEKKLGRALNGIYARARDFRSGRRLGVYAKARLGNTFKWELRDLGYASEFVDRATRGLILNLSSK